MKKRKFLLILLLTLGMGLLTTTTRATELEWNSLYQILTGANISWKNIAVTAGGGSNRAGVYSENLEDLRGVLKKELEFSLKDNKRVENYDASKEGLWKAAKETLSINNKDYIYCLSDIYSGSGETEAEMLNIWTPAGLESFDRIRVAMWRENKSNEVNLTIICLPFIWGHMSFSDLEVYNFKKEIIHDDQNYYVDVSYSEKNVNKENSLKAMINRLIDSSDKLNVDDTISKAKGDYKSIDGSGVAKSDIICQFILNAGDKKKETTYRICDVLYDQYSRLVFYNIKEAKDYYDDGTKKTDKEINDELDKGIEELRAKARKYATTLAGVTGTKRDSTTYNDVLENVNVYDPGNVTETGGILDIGSKILGGINIVGVVASVIILAVLGLKFIMGSVEEKAEIKESLVPYVIGIVLLVGITTIVNVLYNFGQSLK